MEKNNDALRRKALRMILSPGALERLGRIKIVKPQLALQIEEYLLNLYQLGKINRQITETEMIKILETINTPNKKFRIVR